MSHGVPRHAPQSWCKNYQDQDPFVREFCSIPTGSKRSVVLSNEVINEKDYCNSRFYTEFMKPQAVHHVMIIGLKTNARPIGIFGLHRPAAQRVFSRREAEKAQLIASHLSVAVDRLRKSNSLKTQACALDEITTQHFTRGVIILSDHLGLIYESDHNLSHLLPFSVYQACARFQTEVRTRRKGTKTYSERVSQSIGQEKYVEIFPLGCKDEPRGFIIYLLDESDTCAKPDELRALGFTRRQTDIIRLLETGMTNGEIAIQLDISIRTVQNHLRVLYSKLNVHNRTSLLHQIHHNRRTSSH